MSREEILGKNWFDTFIPESDAGAVKEVFKRIIAGDPEPDAFYENTVLSSSGGERVIAWHNTILRNESGLVEGVLSAGEDITEQKQAEAEAKLQLEEKELLLREVHHRIKNNIASIQSLLSLQAASIENAEAKQILREAENRVKGMRLIYDKLLLSDKYTEIFSRQYLQDIINAVVGISPDKDTLKVITDIDDFSLSVKKAVSLGIMINELMTNAVKYAFENRKNGEIRVSLSKKKEKAVLVVKDNGRGIPETVDMDNPSSLGLMLIKILTQQLQGSIAFRNNNGTECKVAFSI